MPEMIIRTVSNFAYYILHIKLVGLHSDCLLCTHSLTNTCNNEIVPKGLQFHACIGFTFIFLQGDVSMYIMDKKLKPKLNMVQSHVDRGVRENANVLSLFPSAWSSGTFHGRTVSPGYSGPIPMFLKR